MSNLTDAIECLENAKEFVDAEAEINEGKCDALLAMADSIQQCEYDLRELKKEE